LDYVAILYSLFYNSFIDLEGNYGGKMPYNGTAIGVVCVTDAANRLVVPFVGKELSRWQAGMAQYLQSRVRLAEGSRYNDERH
jgi:hypothetical protein